MKPLDFIDSKEAGEDKFFIKTTCPDCLTFMQWEETDFLTVKIVRVLGYLDVSEDIADVIAAVFARLVMNITGHPGLIVEDETESEPFDFSKFGIQNS